MEPSKTIDWEKEFDEKYVKRTDLRDGKGVDSYLLIEHKGAFAVPPPKLIKSFIQKLLTKICTEHHHLLLKAEQETRERTIDEVSYKVQILFQHWLKNRFEEYGNYFKTSDVLQTIESLKVTKQ